MSHPRFGDYKGRKDKVAIACNLAEKLLPTVGGPLENSHVSAGKDARPCLSIPSSATYSFILLSLLLLLDTLLLFFPSPLNLPL